MILRKLTLALSAVALSFSVSAFAQQTAPQPDQQAPTNRRCLIGSYLNLAA